MANDFTKQLIALLAQAGGSIAIPLADLVQLGIEFTITDLGNVDAAVRLRLGPKIYYVPENKEGAWPTTPATTASPQPSSPTTIEPARSSRLDEEISAVNSLNNRPRRQQLPRQVNPEEHPPSPQRDETHSLGSVAEEALKELTGGHLPPATEAERQEELTGPLPPVRRVIPKTDMDLFLREQQIASQKETAQQRRAAKDRQRTRQYPWETRNAPPLKLQ